MGRCIALNKDLERCKNETEKGSLFCRRHRWWWLMTLFAGIIAVTTIGANIATMFGFKFPNPFAVQGAPVIDSIDFPQTIICDGRTYNALIHFHDLNGDVYKSSYERDYSKENTKFFPEPIEVSVDSETQKRGAVFSDYVAWTIPGDDVRIKVTIEDRLGLTDSKVFGFTCSN